MLSSLGEKPLFLAKLMGSNSIFVTLSVDVDYDETDENIVYNDDDNTTPQSIAILTFGPTALSSASTAICTLAR